MAVAYPRSWATTSAATAGGSSRSTAICSSIAGSKRGSRSSIGKAAVRREGKDLSLITYGAMMYNGLDAAEALDKEGVSVEVIDLRSLSPLDDEAILATVKKTLENFEEGLL